MFDNLSGLINSFGSAFNFCNPKCVKITVKSHTESSNYVE